MKTLDEMIKALEKCTSYGNSCLNCPYDKGYKCFKAREKDCLYYLKEYREMKNHLACMDNGEIRGDDTQVVNNPPLSEKE